MSHSFYAGGASSLAYEDVLPAIGGDLRCVEHDADALAGPWQPGYLHLYRWGVSTRSVEVSVADGELCARVMVGSCPEDYQLAVDLVTAAARAGGGTVTGEDGPEDIVPGAVGEHWGVAWIQDHSHAMARTVLAMAGSRDATGDAMTMNGPIRPFSLGPRTRATLGDVDDGIEQRLFAMMRRLQYIAPDDDEGDGVYCARCMSMRRDETEVRFAVWGQGVAYLMPPVDYLALVGASQMFIPLAAAEVLAPGRVEYLDDTHALITAVPADEWDSLVDAARQHAVDPFGGDGT